MNTEKKETFTGAEFIPEIAAAVQSEFMSQGYDVSRNDLANGDVFVSLTKSGFFRTVSGFKTALNLSLKPVGGNRFVASSKFGFWDTQGIPTAITLLVFWPLVIAQTMGYKTQQQLNAKVIALVRRSLENAKAKHASAPPPPPSGSSFCPDCGARCAEDAVFCSKCGTKLAEDS
jgi:hypothetical protein